MDDYDIIILVIKMNRNKTRSVRVGNLTLGGNDKVYIQSMTTTKTNDIEATVKQILELENAGCEIIRVSVLNMEDALSLGKIKSQIHIPLVADIHFDYKLAIEAINQGVDKIRINPGNITDQSKVSEICKLAKEKRIPIHTNSKVIEKISNKGNVYLMARFEKYTQSLEKNKNHVLLVNPSDMGNLGTIIRVMLGFGYKNLAIITPCIDHFDPKVIRASMGAIFGINIELYNSLEE